MSIVGKQRVTQIIYILGFVASIFCLLQMVPIGIAGDTGRVKLWFFLMIVSVIITVPCALAYYYYRSRSKDLEGLRASAKILSATGDTLGKSRHL